MIDEREDKMSGSAMASYAACQGKYQLERTCPRSESGPAAITGNRIHKYLAGETIELTDEEQHIAEGCLMEYGEILATLRLGTPDTTIIETRYWYNDVWSGQIDLIQIWGTTALIIDWKSGRTGTGNTAAENLQLRAYSVLVKKNIPEIKEIYCAIIQPMAALLSIAHYDESDLDAADKEIAQIIDNSRKPDAPRTPSPDACKYCRAKAICPEAAAVTHDLIVAPSAVPALSNEAIGDFLEKADVVEGFIEALREEGKKRLLEGQEIAGRKIQAGRTSRSIEAVEDLVPLLKDTLDTEEILKCCKVSVPQLEKAFASNAGLKPKEAKAALEAKLESILVSKTGAPMMVRAK